MPVETPDRFEFAPGLTMPGSNDNQEVLRRLSRGPLARDVGKDGR